MSSSMNLHSTPGPGGYGDSMTRNSSFQGCRIVGETGPKEPSGPKSTTGFSIDMASNATLDIPMTISAAAYSEGVSNKNPRQRITLCHERSLFHLL